MRHRSAELASRLSTFVSQVRASQISETGSSGIPSDISTVREEWYREPSAKDVADGCFDDPDVNYEEAPRGINWLPDEIDRVVKPKTTIAFVGASGSGKTVMALDLLLRHRRYYSYGLAVCSTDDGIAKLSRIIPCCLVVRELTLDLYRAFLEFGRSLVAECGGDEDLAPAGFLFGDDVGFNRELFNSKEMKEACSAGRHFNQGYYWLVQYHIDLPPFVRKQAKSVFVFRTNADNAIQFYFREYFAVVGKDWWFDNPKAGTKGLFNQATGQRRALVYIRNEDSNAIEDTVFVHMVRDPDWVMASGKRMCVPFLWWLNDLFYYNRGEQKMAKFRSGLMQRRVQALTQRNSTQAITDSGGAPRWTARGAAGPDRRSKHRRR